MNTPHHLATIMPAQADTGHYVFCACGWSKHVTLLAYVHSVINQHMDVMKAEPLKEKK